MPGSRNDDHSGGMLPRLHVCIDNLREQSERYELASEVVLLLVASLRPYHLTQKLPVPLLESKGNPYRHLVVT